MLNQYLEDTTALLRDANFLFNAKTQLIRYINLARDQVAKQTDCIRGLAYGQAPFGTSAVPGTAMPGAMYPGTPDVQQFVTLQGLEKYSFGYALPFLQQTTQGVRGILDVDNVAVSWGGIRPSLNWMPWEDLQAYARSYNFLVTSYPFVWSSYGGGGNKGQVWLFPIPTILNGELTAPGGQGELEWDCSCLPKYLYTDSDYEAIPDPFTNAVKFYAAHLAFLGSQRFGMANIMLSLFNDDLGIDNSAVLRGRTSQFYYGDR